MIRATWDQHLDAIAAAAARLAEHAAAAGPTAPVPTCPRWTVAHLVAHQGMVHRWAAANLRGDKAPTPSLTSVLRTVPAAELPAWFDAGVAALLTTLRTVPADVRAPVFLRDAAAPRAFWARRQAHETTIHAVDALAAALGRLPSAAEVGLDAGLAVDGLDELLRGFVPRGRTRLAPPLPRTIVVRPVDADAAWLLRVAADAPVVTERVDAATLPEPAPGGCDAVFAGSAAQLYLGLWNRGTEIAVTGHAPALDDWRGAQRITW